MIIGVRCWHCMLPHDVTRKPPVPMLSVGARIFVDCTRRSLCGYAARALLGILSLIGFVSVASSRKHWCCCLLGVYGLTALMSNVQMLY